MKRWQLLAAAVAVLALLGGGGAVAWSALRASPEVSGAPVPAGEPLDPASPAEALVFVSGAVVHPGLYRLPTSARVADAVAAAGGITADADPGHLPNLAARIHDGRQVNIPFLKGARATGGTGTSSRLDINSATADQLAAVPGMPLGLPQAIIDSRAGWGPFTSLTELHTLLGVDTATVTALRPYLRVVAPAR